MNEPIAAYFAATNLASIREWMEEAIKKYRFTVEVTGIAEANGNPFVTGRVSGTFPGSPVDLRHFFTLAGKKITRLEIIP